MSKPKIPNQRKANIEHKKRVEKYASQIKMIYDRMAEESARLASLSDPDTSKPFNFADYTLTKNNIKKLQQQLYNDVSAVIMSGTSEEWKESNLVQNLVVKRVLTAYTGTYRNGEEYTRYYQTNPDALKAFQNRKESGMNLSDRVWNLSEEYRVELEDAISAAIAPGISAQELSMEVRKYLNEPDLMFRRFRYKNEQGEWKRKWKKRYTDDEGNVRFIDCDRDSYRNQWTGLGYYKSSAKNAMRLARTEINMAYRTAEQERWKQFDFVVGYEVKTTQNGHHIEDICDRLAGKYPKDFKFTGWHPQCMCYCIPILKTEEEFWSYDPENPEKSANEITELPSNFHEWINDNRERIEAAEKRGKLPYFIRDNRDDVEDILNHERFKNLKYFSSEDFNSIQNGNFFGSGSIIKLNEILSEKGFTNDEIKQLAHLIDLHRHGGENQINTDIEMALHFRDKNSRLGAMLRMESEIEEEAYRIYRYKNPPIKIARAGDMSRDTFSFTMNKDGIIKTIENEEIYWGVNIKTTLDDILKDNNLVAGLLRSDIGYSDERELFFISKNTKQLTPQFIQEWENKQKQKRNEDERKKSMKEFNQKKDETAMQLMSLLGQGVPMDKIMKLQQEFFNIQDGDLDALNRIIKLIQVTKLHS